MPYFIAVLALVVLGVGFTLFKHNEVALELPADNSVAMLETEFNIPTTTQSEFAIIDEAVPRIAPVEAAPPIETTPINPTILVPAPVIVKPTTIVTTTYVDGIYSTHTNYRTPNGTYQMMVGVTVKDDEVTTATLSFDSEGARDSYSKRFTSSYKNTLIGNDLETVNLSRIGGASLTTKAFNTALSNIRAQAG